MLMGPAPLCGVEPGNIDEGGVLSRRPMVVKPVLILRHLERDRKSARLVLKPLRRRIAS